jgi:hypothetical protein
MFRSSSKHNIWLKVSVQLRLHVGWINSVCFMQLALCNLLYATCFMQLALCSLLVQLAYRGGLVFACQGWKVANQQKELLSRSGVLEHK